MTDKELPGNINTGIGFLNHMLVLFEKHGGFNLDLFCKLCRTDCQLTGPRF